MTPQQQHALDKRLMNAAISLASSAEGSTFPNPPVGCIIAHNAEIVAFAATASNGRPHAETQALASAGSKAKGATLYSTLEPCAHKNTHNTPPCCEDIVKAKISRTCYALEDPDPRTGGKCKKILEKNNIAITQNLCAKEASEQLEPYFKRCKKNIPFCNLKLAASIDGKITAASHADPKTRTLVSGEETRRYRNDLLRRSDAVFIGARTMRLDNPRLLLDDKPHSEQAQQKNPFAPIRIVLDGGLTLPLESKLVQTIDQAPLWILTRAGEASSDKGKALKNSGVRLIPVPAVSKQGGGVCLSLCDAMRTLAEEGVASILCEGGARLAHALLQANLVDRLTLFSAPHALGAQGLSMFEGVDSQRIDFRFEESFMLGEDEVRLFRPRQHDHV